MAHITNRAILLILAATFTRASIADARQNVSDPRQVLVMWYAGLNWGDTKDQLAHYAHAANQNERDLLVAVQAAVLEQHRIRSEVNRRFAKLFAKEANVGGWKPDPSETERAVAKARLSQENDTATLTTADQVYRLTRIDGEWKFPISEWCRVSGATCEQMRLRYRVLAVKYSNIFENLSKIKSEGDPDTVEYQLSNLLQYGILLLNGDDQGTRADPSDGAARQRAAKAFKPATRPASAEASNARHIDQDNVQTQAEEKPGAPRLMTQVAPSTSLVACTFSKDGKYVATSDGVDATLWSVQNGDQIRRFGSGATLRFLGPQSGAVFDADENGVAGLPRVLLSLSQKNEFLFEAKPGLAVVFAAGNGRQLRQIRAPTAAMSLDGRHLLVAGRKGGAAIQETLSGKELIKLTTGNSVVSAVSLSEDNASCLLGLADGTVELRRLPSGEKAKTFGKVGREPVVFVSISPDGSRAVFGLHESRNLWLINLKQNSPARELDTGFIPASGAFSGDGQSLITAGAPAKVWDVTTGQMRVKVYDEAYAAAMSPNGKTVLTAGRHYETGRDSGAAWLRRVNDGKLLGTLDGTVIGTTCVSVSYDGEYAACGFTDGIVRVWNLRSGNIVQNITGTGGPIMSLVFSPDSPELLVGYMDGAVILWDVTTGKDKCFYSGPFSIASLDFSPNGQYVLITCQKGGTAQLFDRKSGHELSQYAGGPIEWPTYAQFAADGRAVLMTGVDGILARFWKIETGTTMRHFVVAPPDPHEPFGPDGSFVTRSNDGRYVLTLSDDGALVWNAATGVQLAAIRGSPIRFLPQSAQVIGTDGYSLVIWDALSGRPVTKFLDTVTQVASLAFVPGGQYFLTAELNGTVRLWDMTTRRVIANFVASKSGNWITSTQEGQFDTNNLESVEGMRWVFPDDPFRALPPETFMRDYYEPHLLSRLLHRNKNELQAQFRPVRQLQDLNRAVPLVGKPRVERLHNPDTVRISIDLRPGIFQVDGGKKWETEAYDLRLFRNGQLVGQCPELADDAVPLPQGNSEVELKTWRTAYQVNERTDRRVERNKDGSMTVSFEVRLPHRPFDAISFTAYAFNQDRVKSGTAVTQYQVPADVFMVTPTGKGTRSAIEPR